MRRLLAMLLCLALVGALHAGPEAAGVTPAAKTTVAPLSTTAQAAPAAAQGKIPVWLGAPLAVAYGTLNVAFEVLKFGIFVVSQGLAFDQSH